MKINDIVVRALTVIAGVIGSAGFVAAVGGAILWARFDAAQLPADQAVAVASRQELVVVGAVALVGFALAGIGALMLVYLLDDAGTPGNATRWGLVALIVVGIGAAISVDGFSPRCAILLGAGFAAAGVAVVYLLELAEHGLAATTAAERRPEALIARAWRALFSGVDWVERARRAFGAALLVLGVVLSASASEPALFVLWAVVSLVVLETWNVVRRGHVHLRAIVAIALIAYGATALIRYERSLAIIAAVALALGALNLSVAKATRLRFALYGICVFASVVVFGAVLSYMRTHDSPKLQGVAVALTGGGPVQCGLYVAETGSRLYLARVSVVPRGTRASVVADSGRLFWIPRDRIERFVLGSLEGVVHAQSDAADLRDELLAERRLTAAGSVPSARPAPVQGDIASSVDANGCSPGAPEPPARQTRQRALARKFQPRLVVDRGDGFWPISAQTIFRLRHGDRRTCRNVGSGECVDVTHANRLPWIGGVGEWLEYPGKDTSRGQQHDDMVAALGSADPARTAREYFFVTGGEYGGDTTSVQYWFYYGFNYQRLGLHGIDIGTAGYHEGDFESMGVLLSADKRPVYVWMPRHSDEGRPLVWSEPQFARAGDHATVYAALGSHATYDACATEHRAQLPAGLINDRPQCDRLRQLVLEPQVTPLSDLALAPWACWQGRFGHASRKRRSAAATAVLADGPLSPLWQQNFGRRFSPCSAVAQAPQRPDAGEEVLDDATGNVLRAHGGRLDGVFDSCSDWQKPPPSGVYVVACNDDALRGYFASGLRDVGGDAISIRGRDGRAQPPSLPAVYRRADAVAPDGVTLTAPKATSATVYAACYARERRIVATFPAVPLGAGRTVVLHTGAKTWTLTGSGAPRAATPQTAAKTARCGRG